MPPPIPGLILAGGRSSRMNGPEKTLVSVAGKTLLQRVIERARPQTDGLLLNANGDASRFAAYGLPVLPDDIDGFAGPLAGILAGLDWLRTHRPDVRWMVSLATDTPLFPTDLVDRLYQAAQDSPEGVAIARCDGDEQPVFGLWPVALAADLRDALTNRGLRKMRLWTSQHHAAYADWTSADGNDPFLNVNTPDDVAALSRILHQMED